MNWNRLIALAACLVVVALAASAFPVTAEDLVDEEQNQANAAYWEARVAMLQETGIKNCNECLNACSLICYGEPPSCFTECRQWCLDSYCSP